MSEGVPVDACVHCGHEVFPVRLVCPRCGGSEWGRNDVSEGVVEESTLLRRAPGEPELDPVYVGSVRVADGVIVVARLEAGVEDGAAVRLQYREGIPVAHPREP
jgi:uncharacterized OB-fold protein